jgi:hypothetical protein
VGILLTKPITGNFAHVDTSTVRSVVARLHQAYAIGSKMLPNSYFQYIFYAQVCCGFFFDIVMRILGPILIALASGTMRMSHPTALTRFFW